MLIPNRVTIFRASWVTLSMSFEAPEVMSSKTISSAARPPNKPMISANQFLSARPGSGLLLGRARVYPAAIPRVMMVTLLDWICFRECIHHIPHDQLRGKLQSFSLLELIKRLFVQDRQSPVQWLLQTQAVPTTFLFRRAARIAASFTRFSRSAPTNPGVDLASTAKSISGINGFPLTWTFRIASRPRTSGRSRYHPAVKTTGTKQSRIKNIRAVGGCHDNYIRIGFKTVHFNQHLVQGLFTFIMTATQSSTTLTSDCIDFIDKNDTG